MQPILIISDFLGDSAAAIVDAAVSQFELDEVLIERLPGATTINAIESFVADAQLIHPEEALVVFFTIANPDLCMETKKLLNKMSITYVDVLGPAINAIARASNLVPLSQPELIHKTSKEYYQRLEAIEFA
ncbi:MAG: kinase/pyrophosphorylase, partial [Coriobacteriales bacterium]|nr:kinase/pyrophosphorylase [Coriobacteriales bacterium]